MAVVAVLLVADAAPAQLKVPGTRNTPFDRNTYPPLTPPRLPAWVPPAPPPPTIQLPRLPRDSGTTPNILPDPPPRGPERERRIDGDGNLIVRYANGSEENRGKVARLDRDRNTRRVFWEYIEGNQRYWSWANPQWERVQIDREIQALRQRPTPPPVVIVVPPPPPPVFVPPPVEVPPQPPAFEPPQLPPAVPPQPPAGPPEQFSTRLKAHFVTVPQNNGTFTIRITRNPEADSPLAADGFEPGDVIVRLDGQPFRTLADVEGHVDATTVDYINVRNNQRGRLTVTLPR
jgi:hypothetical protein